MMDNGKGLELLFHHASTYQFHDFEKSFLEQAPRFSAAELGEACLMRAQIKLFVADETLLSDLEKADRNLASSRFPCLKDRWEPDSPNRFVVFPDTPGALSNFLRVLPQVEEKLHRWHGITGGTMVRQMQGEILYFLGDFDGALRLMEKLRGELRQPCADTVLLQYVQFRCYLALGLRAEAERCMLDVIRTAKTRPECIAPYNAIRTWANLTTGWSGDTPRFLDTSRGEKLPVLEDRLEAIRKGISHLSPLEEPFVAYAERSYREAYTVRRHYMDLFHAIFWFQAGDYPQAENYFLQAYRVASASGLVMPFAEYGGQIIPLVLHIASAYPACSSAWIDSILSLAEQYERSLQAYRT